jgi:hypothetical protein
VKHTRVVLVGVCLIALAMTAAVLTMALGSASAEDSSADTMISRNLETQGIKGTSVSLQNGSLEVTLSSTKGGAPEDTWARTVVQREAEFLATSSDLSDAQLGITIVDEQGNVVYRCEGPIEAQSRPAAKEAPVGALSSAEIDLAAQAEKVGVVLKGLSLDADPSQGLIVDAKTGVISSPGQERDAQIRWATVGLLGELRDYCEGTGRLDVDLYRLRIEDSGGNVLVSYIVDPRTRSVRAWMAPGVTPVWCQGQPASMPAGAATTP